MWMSNNASASAASTPPASPPGRTRFGRLGGRAPDSTATKPTVAHISNRHACTAASAREAVVPHRVDQRPRRLHEYLAPEREDESTLLRRQRAAIAARSPSGWRSNPRSRRRRAAGERFAKRRSAIASTSASLLPILLYSGTGETPSRAATLRMLTASSPDSRKISTAALTISSASRSKSALPAHGTITSLPTTRRSASRWSALGSSSNVGVAVTAFRRLPSATRRDNPRWISSSSAGD